MIAALLRWWHWRSYRPIAYRDLPLPERLNAYHVQRPETLT